MSLKNLNVNILTCLDTISNKNGTPTYNNLFDIIIPERVGSKLYSPKMDIIAETSIIIEKSKELDDFIGCDHLYSCAITVTFYGELFQTLGEFKINTSSEKLSLLGNKAWFCTNTYCAEQQQFEIPEPATYCDIALLVYCPNLSDGKKWVVQTVKRLYINRKI